MIAIKDMEMPKSCRHCPCSDDLQCNLTTQYNDLKEKPNNCPLVEIVTCKDCKYFERLTCLGGQCVCPTNTYINETTNDFYCADAERRE